MAIAVAVLVVVSGAYYYTTTIARPSSTPGLDGFTSHIDHIVFLVLENHAFDNYFGMYCPNTGPYCPDASSGFTPGQCIPLGPGPGATCVKPYNYTESNWTLVASLPHNWVAGVSAVNGGAMDNFYTAEHSGLIPFGSYNGSTAPIYWDLAEQYSLNDNFFASVLDYSLPNHWHMVAAQSPQQVLDNFTQPHDGSPISVAGNQKYLNEANATHSIEDLLYNSSVSWKYYDFGLPPYSNAIHIRTDANGTINQVGLAYDYWNPLAARAASYTSYFNSHFVNNTMFYSDARNGTLPQISWVIPTGFESDHPPQNSTTAQAWTASIVNAVESSPNWGSTALFITWDDYGGFYDGVPPPTIDGGQQLGLREPLIVVSPYARQGAVVNQQGYFESVLHLMEERYNLGCLNALDCGAPLPLAAFDFSAPPRPPMLFPTSVQAAVYPMALQNSAATGPPPPPYYPPTNFSLNSNIFDSPDID